MVTAKKQVNIDDAELRIPRGSNAAFHLVSFRSAEKGFGEHQRSFGSGHEVRQVLPGLQADPEDSPPGKGQADHHRQQHSPSQVTNDRRLQRSSISHTPFFRAERRISILEPYGVCLSRVELRSMFPNYCWEIYGVVSRCGQTGLSVYGSKVATGGWPSEGKGLRR